MKCRWCNCDTEKKVPCSENPDMRSFERLPDIFNCPHFNSEKHTRLPLESGAISTSFSLVGVEGISL